MEKAFLPGSFDPPTHGHMNLIKRAAALCDELHVVISINDVKSPLFTIEERIDLLKELTKEYNNIKITSWKGLIVNFAEEQNIDVMFRGVRALADFSYEFELAMTNKGLKKDIEVIFLPSDPKYFVLRSSAIKEIAHYGGHIDKMVPEIVAVKLKSKLKSVDNS